MNTIQPIPVRALIANHYFCFQSQSLSPPTSLFHVGTIHRAATASFSVIFVRPSHWGSCSSPSVSCRHSGVCIALICSTHLWFFSSSVVHRPVRVVNPVLLQHLFFSSLGASCQLRIDVRLRQICPGFLRCLRTLVHVYRVWYDQVPLPTSSISWLLSRLLMFHLNLSFHFLLIHDGLRIIPSEASLVVSACCWKIYTCAALSMVFHMSFEDFHCVALPEVVVYLISLLPPFVAACARAALPYQPRCVSGCGSSKIGLRIASDNFKGILSSFSCIFPAQWRVQWTGGAVDFPSGSLTRRSIRATSSVSLTLTL